MNDEHIKIVLNHYGKFHALSFAIKDQKHDIFKYLSFSLQQTAFESYEDIYPMYVTNLVNFLKTWEGSSDLKVVDDVNCFRQNFRNFMKQMSEYDDDCNIFIHGDCWCNNMMFKYEVNIS